MMDLNERIRICPSYSCALHILRNDVKPSSGGMLLGSRSDRQRMKWDLTVALQRKIGDKGGRDGSDPKETLHVDICATGDIVAKVLITFFDKAAWENAMNSLHQSSLLLLEKQMKVLVVNPEEDRCINKDQHLDVPSSSMTKNATLVWRHIPLKWFQITEDDRTKKTSHGVYTPSKTFSQALECFGTVQHMELRPSLRKRMNEEQSLFEQRVRTSSMDDTLNSIDGLPQMLNFDAFIQFKESEAFEAAWNALRGDKVLRRDAKFTIPICVQMGDPDYFSVVSIRKRRFQYESEQIEAERKLAKEKELAKGLERQMNVARIDFDALVERLEACKRSNQAFSMPSDEVQKSLMSCQQFVNDNPKIGQLDLESFKKVVESFRSKIEDLERDIGSHTKSIQNEELEERLKAWTSTIKDFQEKAHGKFIDMNNDMNNYLSRHSKSSEHIAMLADVKSAQSSLNALGELISSTPELDEKTTEEDLQQYAQTVDDRLEDARDEIESVKERLSAVQDIMLIEKTVETWNSGKNECPFQQKAFEVIDDFRMNELPKIWVASTSDLQKAYDEYRNLTEQYEEMSKIGAVVSNFESRVRGILRESLAWPNSSKTDIVDQLEKTLEKSKKLALDRNLSGFYELGREREQLLAEVEVLVHQQKSAKRESYLKHLELFHRKSAECRKRLRKWQTSNGLEMPIDYQKNEVLNLRNRMPERGAEHISIITGVSNVSLLLHTKAVAVSVSRASLQSKIPFVPHQQAPRKISERAKLNEEKLRALALESKYRSSALAALKKAKESKTDVP